VVEHIIRNDGVAGSSPASGTILKNLTHDEVVAAPPG
jgi:hypothetical protein